MAGHSKWKQIKHYKAAADAKRGALFTKLIREITIAAKQGGGDPGGNARLRLAIETARQNSMPKENIERAVKKGTGELEGVDYQELTYEGYGPGGVAIMIGALTDNATRTVADLRHTMSRGGGTLGTPNSVAFMFDRKAQLAVDATKYAEDRVLEAAMDGGAEDMARDGDQFTITTEPSAFHAVKDALESKGIAVTEAEPVVMMPKSSVKVEGGTADQLLKLLEALEEMDDVQKVWANFDMDVADMANAG
ncbi:MAG: YebC/PmpR family DNA-binding transcriptional regulator [Gemmatimonadota bacterium]|nr:YebC/PmpR family DNA-binding transcriptional regulator [Gemmatimonadota bacterium]MDE3173272.1 YebC/PmpR family DNA-binding transcriptional regulator [Gemmatimonadota bacterium]MDE3216773.1 YebC/PmpR family DNA-binding transcriptional regulator [Gemmatimonadota bacterium]